MCHRYKALRNRSLTIAAVGLALCLAMPASAKPPSWDKKIEGKGRFKVLKAFDGEAVLDRETGLVWQQAPSAQTRDWVNANDACRFAEIGGRGGWRLPRSHELASLFDIGAGALPSEHPFEATEGVYWSATSLAGYSGPVNSRAEVLGFGGAINASSDKMMSNWLTWCVRGGAGIDR